MRRALLAGLIGALVFCPSASAALPEGFVGLYSEDAGQLALQASFGSQTVRRPFDWSQVERSPGEYDFSIYDGFVAAAARAGVQVLPFLATPPKFWSSKPKRSRSNAVYPPKSNAAFARFVSAAVNRYGSKGSFWQQFPDVPFVPIKSWQLWNEPNIPNWWRSGPSAKRYVALLRAGAKAVRKADPGAEVVTAGLPNSKLGVPFLRYLEGMYRAGAKGLFDTLAIHPYSAHVSGLLSLAESARRVMNRHHDHAKLWITELGWSTAGDPSVFRVGEMGQAQRISSALSGLIGEQQALRLRGFILFQWRDAIAPPGLGKGDPWPLHAGLLRTNGKAKPGFWSFVFTVDAARKGEPGGSSAPVQISRQAVRLSPLGFAAVGVGCSSDDPGACGGKLTLRAAKSARCGGHRLARGAVLGEATFRVAVAPAIVPVHVGSAARRVVHCAKRGVAVRASAGPPVQFVLRG